MNTVSYIVFVETVTGEVIRAFTWHRDPYSGMERARREAQERGIPVTRVFYRETTASQENNHV